MQQNLTKKNDLRLLVGAYAASPCSDTKWDPKLEEQYFAGLKKLPLFGGVEHPFTGSLHPDPSWFLRQLQPDWQIVITCIPGVMTHLKRNPHFGLASDNLPGRMEALDFMKECQKAVKMINDSQQRKVVTAVQIHSAPTKSFAEVRSSKELLQDSILTLSQDSWDDAFLVVEHCDAFIPGQPAAKGFLSLEDEIAALQFCNREQKNLLLGITINWARSAIEGRSPGHATEHIQKAAHAKLLRGLIFSGCCDDPLSLYGAWADNHMPLVDETCDVLPHKGLLDRKAIAEALQACRTEELGYLGIKIKPLPTTCSVSERVAFIDRSLRLLDAVFKTDLKS